MFFKSRPKESPEALAQRLQQAGKFEDLESELQRYNPKKLSAKDRESYYHLRGIVSFRKGDHLQALKRFQEGLKECPDSQLIKFSLGQEYEWLGDSHRAFELFDQCSFPGLPGRYCLAMSRYAYLWSEYARMERYLLPVAEAYFELGIADDHFVYVRGLPFYAQTFTYLLAAARQQDNFLKIEDLLVRSEASLSEYDFSSLRLFTRALKQRDSKLILEFLHSKIAAANPQFPQGYQKVQLACFEVSNLSSVEEGEACLNVPLTEKDFPWLADILLAKRAELFHKHQRVRDADVLEQELLSKQALLLEPDYAVYFNLLDFLEQLKSRYIRNRQVVATAKA